MRRSRTASTALLLPLMLLVQVACNSAGIGTFGTRPASSSQVSVGEAAGAEQNPSANVADNRVAIWAEVPATTDGCNCDTPPLEELVGALKDAHLDKGFKQQSIVGTSQVFSITFDPEEVPAERVEEMIKGHGGTILRGPAPADETYSFCQCGLE